MFDKLMLTIQILRGDFSRMLEMTNDEEGATMVEYGLLVVGIAVVVGGAALALGGRIATMFQGIIP
ncbi:Flp family type IVb pilin [Egicoccus halophilus]|uniref:Pilus assembly protein Flp/PilA n=1 Tax=Egicoccus halophilus TaxID=1670830 RepID=A0A8J3ETA8_9ACTN|nr:Flp family type IVb pilin [Egicoccus halophilus]GGI04839.1 hypothetical protein GCM10011354_11100 [Egicoccus halophilus]